MTDFDIPEAEIQLADDFLMKFTVISESSMNDHLDLVLMISALPNKVVSYTLDQIELFNFSVF